MDPEEDFLPRKYYSNARGAADTQNNSEEPAATTTPSSLGGIISDDDILSLSSLPQSVVIVRGNTIDDDSTNHHDHDDDDDDGDDYHDEYDGGSSSSRIHDYNKTINSSGKSNSGRSSRDHHNRSIRSSGSHPPATTAATVSASRRTRHQHDNNKQPGNHPQQYHRHGRSSAKHKSSFAPRELSLPNSSRRAAAARARRNNNDDDDDDDGGKVERPEYYSSGDGSGVDDNIGDDGWEMERDNRGGGVTFSKANPRATGRKAKKQPHLEPKTHDKDHYLPIEEEGGDDGRKHDPKQHPRHRPLLLHPQQGIGGGDGGGRDDEQYRPQRQDHHHRRRRRQRNNNDNAKKAAKEQYEEKEESDDDDDYEMPANEKNRTNSPEPNIHRKTLSTPLQLSVAPTLTSRLTTAAAVDPKEESDTKTYFSRLDAPPTPTGPERNACRRIGEEAALLQLPLVSPATGTSNSTKSSMVGGGGTKDEKGGASGHAARYNNYILDEEGIRQYRQQHGKIEGKEARASTSFAVNTSLPMTTTTTMISRMNIQDASHNSTAIDTNLKCDKKADPPASGRGCDPTPLTTPVIYRRRTSVEADNGGGGEGRKQQKDARKESSSRTKDKSQSISKSRKPIEVKSILKKRDAPIPLTQFGKPVLTKNDDEEDANTNYDSDQSGASLASDPDVIELKQKAFSSSTRNSDTQAVIAPTNSKDEDSKCSMTTAKSGLRKGKYSALNDSLAKSSKKQDRINRNNDDNDGNDVVGMKKIDEAENDKSNTDDSSNSDADTNDADAHKKETSFDSPIGSNSQRFDRSQSHYMRTADLGMTQDTIFPEQFMEDLKAKPEPHYHHPSPHPPPGVAFHIDENWICLDDGKTGSHSPIAPQAVDALVDMGYRAASNPMMWTPNAKTRKYMTEKGLRFDDIPIPGPLDEGDGTPGDTSSVLVWSGKFPHKYHGHDVPAIRSQGIVNMSPEALVDLLMDSDRVSEYNKSNISRDDELVLSDGTNLDSSPFSGQRKKKVTGVVMRGAKVVDGNAVFDSETDDEQSEQEEGGDETMDDTGSKSVRTMLSSVSKRERHQSRFVGVTKLVRTKNKPPLVRKVLEFITLLHCRALTDDQGGDGYIIVARAVTPASEAESNKKGVVHCEILLNVHIIRRLRGEKKKSSSQQEKGKGGKSRNVSTSGKKAGKGDLANRCLLINVNHLKSPLVPSLVSKTVGLSAALNFITDIRATVTLK